MKMEHTRFIKPREIKVVTGRLLKAYREGRVAFPQGAGEDPTLSEF
jgi:hypothetical protein